MLVYFARKSYIWMKTLQKKRGNMKGKSPDQNQMNLLQNSLKDMLNPKEELYLLTEKMDWDYFEEAFGFYYIDFGRPAKPIRLMVSLLILKQLHNISDEVVVRHWRQNPYWQYFSGMDVFQWEFPCTPSDLTHFRNRIGKKGAEKILEHSIKLHGEDALESEVLVDSTVQEKNITFPTDVKLYRKIINKSRKIAKQASVDLRQSYVRVEKELLLLQRFRHHPRNKKKALAAQRKLRTIAGRLIRELERKLDKQALEKYVRFFTTANKVMGQQRGDREKVYSLHEPEVYCISKGKEAKKYEFGTKASICMTKNSGIIVGAMNIHNQYDGHSLPKVLSQVAELTGQNPKAAIVDRGYRGRKQIEQTSIIGPTSGKGKNNYERQKARKRFRRRAGIEPVIGHLKSDHRMLRNYLKGTAGDDINILLSSAAFNYKKMLRKLRSFLILINYGLKNSLDHLFSSYWIIWKPLKPEILWQMRTS
jgi:IS5 family transposase